MLQPTSKLRVRTRVPLSSPGARESAYDAVITLGSMSLTPGELWEFARHALDPGKRLAVRYSSEAIERMEQAASMVARLAASEEPVYGINTGFGHFANIVIPPERIVELQYNIVRSHCCGVGELLSRDLVMAMWLIDLNTICRGNSGLRVETMESIAQVLEAGILACVPSQGSVGASGDLAPAAHAAQAILGEGRCTMPHKGEFVELTAAEAMRRAGLQPVRLGVKEGLSLVNGTMLTTALAVKAWYEGCHLLEIANLAAAMTIEALGGSRMVCSELATGAHGHPGTIHCGRQMREWLGSSSELSAVHVEKQWIQDPYSLRCAPQVHGAIWEELQASEAILKREMNAAADNPLVFPEEMTALCCGNFHAVYPARVCDRLASAFATLASISERRISHAMRAPRGHLPTFLVNDGGVNSGMMMAQVTAAALVSESKSLSFPASVDSIPTNLLQEDHVSMGPIAGMKANRIVENLRRVLAIELMAAAQALDLQRPREASARLEEIRTRIRRFVPTLEKDRSLSEDIEELAKRIHDRDILWR